MDCLSSTSSVFGSGWPWALRSMQVPPAGACIVRLESEARRKSSPATPYKGLAGWWTFDRAPEAAQRSMKLHSPSTYSEMDAEWSSMCTLSLALQEESKAKLEDAVTGGDGWGCAGRFCCCCLSVLGLEHSLLDLIQWSSGGVVKPSLQTSFWSTGLSSPKCFTMGCWSEPQSGSVSHLWSIIPRNLCQWSREEDRLLRRLCNCTLTEL